jgi:hypothetical protein
MENANFLLVSGFSQRYEILSWHRSNKDEVVPVHHVMNMCGRMEVERNLTHFSLQNQMKV